MGVSPTLGTAGVHISSTSTLFLALVTVTEEILSVTETLPRIRC